MQRNQDTWTGTIVRCVVVAIVTMIVFVGIASMVESTRSDRIALSPNASERFSRDG